MSQRLESIQGFMNKTKSQNKVKTFALSVIKQTRQEHFPAYRQAGRALSCGFD